MQRRVVGSYRRFGTTYRLHLQGSSNLSWCLRSFWYLPIYPLAFQMTSSLLVFRQNFCVNLQQLPCVLPALPIYTLLFIHPSNIGRIIHIVMCLLSVFLQPSVTFSFWGPNTIQIFVLRMFMCFEHLCVELISNNDEMLKYIKTRRPEFITRMQYIITTGIIFFWKSQDYTRGYYLNRYR
jgi:hypothetical protein